MTWLWVMIAFVAGVATGFYSLRRQVAQRVMEYEKSLEKEWDEMESRLAELEQLVEKEG